MASKETQTGMTLLELIVTLAIVAILIGISIPGIKGQLASYQLRALGREMYGAFQLARLEAVKRQSNCALSFGGMTDGEAADCHVYVDSNRNCAWDPGEVILTKITIPATNGAFIDGVNFAKNTDLQPSIGYTPRGLSVSPSGGFGAGSVTLKNIHNSTLKVVINSVGRVRIDH